MENEEVYLPTTQSFLGKFMKEKKKSFSVLCAYPTI